MRSSPHSCQASGALVFGGPRIDDGPFFFGPPQTRFIRNPFAAPNQSKELKVRTPSPNLSRRALSRHPRARGSGRALPPRAASSRRRPENSARKKAATARQRHHPVRRPGRLPSLDSGRYGRPARLCIGRAAGRSPRGWWAACGWAGARFSNRAFPPVFRHPPARPPSPSSPSPPSHNRMADTDTFLFTSESVNEGHPDKLADQVSDAILDACLEQDPDAKVRREKGGRMRVCLCLGLPHAMVNHCVQPCAGEARAPGGGRGRGRRGGKLSARVPIARPPIPPTHPPPHPRSPARPPPRPT